MEWTNYVKILKSFFCTVILATLCTVTVWAGTWETTEAGGYQYKNDDGTYLANTWLQEEGKWYFLDENGLLAVNTAVEGYQLGADGAETTGAATITSRYAQVVVPTAQETQETAGAAKQTVPDTEASTATTVTYVLNKNTKKFHKPGCSSVSDMKAKNRVDSGSSREEIIAQGYVPCKRCNP